MIANNPFPTQDSLPSIERLLLAGGDARLTLDPISGQNKYGCQPVPAPQILAFGSSTASVISTEGFAAATQLRQELLEAIGTEPDNIIYARHIQRIRLEWLQLCGLSGSTAPALIFSPSGTDLHAIVAQYTGSGAATPALIIMVETNETGSGVALALSPGMVSTLQTSQEQARRTDKPNANRLPRTGPAEIEQVPIRQDDGTAMPSAAIDARVETLVNQAVASNRRVLLVLVDQSKTGLIAPSPGCAIALQRRFPEHLEVLVDACQFRIAMPTLHAYLEQGFMVALTGSKFLTAPPFSAALLLPKSVAERLQKRVFPRRLSSSSYRAEWPENWTTADSLNHIANFGLLLRCQVALEELRRFRAIPETFVIDFIQTFSQAVRQRLTADPHFEPLPVPAIDRRPLTTGNDWDQLQTIFPFLLYAPQTGGRKPLNREQTLRVYQQLAVAIGDEDSGIAAIRCQLGQPVACGSRHGIAVSALRLCISSRLIIEAMARGDKGETVIKNALAALDKTVLLIQMGS